MTPQEQMLEKTELLLNMSQGQHTHSVVLYPKFAFSGKHNSAVGVFLSLALQELLHSFTAHILQGKDAWGKLPRSNMSLQT